MHINQETVIIEYDTIYAREMYQALQKNTHKKTSDLKLQWLEKTFLEEMTSKLLLEEWVEIRQLLVMGLRFFPPHL